MPVPHRPLRAMLLAGLVLSMASCAVIPEPGGRLPDQPATQARLLPLEEVLAGASATPRASDDVAQGLAGRATRLRNRAALMRGPVQDNATRSRLIAAIRAGGA